MPQEVDAGAYVARRGARSRRVELRGLDHRIVEWGPQGGRPLVLLHGWMDCAMSFQFVVDAFVRERPVVALDFRGFGESAWQPQGYWFPDYLADLDRLLAIVSPDAPADVVGHSLGGNVALLYAGVRPDRVRRVVSLDGFSIRDEPAQSAPDRIAKWLDALVVPPGLASYPSSEALAARLRRNNPRLTIDRARFLAMHWARRRDDGTCELRADPRHKLPFPTVHRLDQTLAVWRRIRAPALWVAASDSIESPRLRARHEGPPPADPLDPVRERMAAIPDARIVVVADAGHMVHHDRPEAVADAIETFLDAP